jgi:SAM-dependent MidA family methyltransferase
LMGIEMPAPMARYNRELIELLTERIRKEGRMDFAAFMDLALYHPVYGYYCSRSPIFGEAGDYRTAPGLHPAFGKRLERLAELVFKETGGPTPFTVLELGGGTGELAENVLGEARKRDGEFFHALHYTILERSPSLLQAQCRRLSRFGGRVTWLSDPADLLQTGPRTGLFIANEFFDALPFHRLRVVGKRVHEVFLTLDASGGLRECEGPCKSPALLSYFSRYGGALEPGFFFEACPEAEEWVKKLDASLARGALLIVDYGDPAGVLLSGRHPAGTARAFRRHTVGEPDPRRAGLEDITASVNFSALAHAALAGQFEESFLSTQAWLLIGLGLLDDFPEPSGSGAIAEAFRLKELVLPGGMGEIYKALLLAKGLQPGLAGRIGLSRDLLVL